jgi:nucleoside-diphosphate-sugar epimerase
MIRNDVRNLVHTETFWQYCADSGAYDPVCLYAATKQAFRDILFYYAKSGAIQAISLVLFDTYGPGDPRRKLFNLLKQASGEARAIDMTPGEQIVDMTHVKDVVEACIHAGAMLISGRSGMLDTYAATSGRRMTLKELVNLVQRATGMSLNINWGGRPYRANEVMVPWLGQPLPGWRPRVELETGIREFFCT